VLDLPYLRKYSPHGNYAGASCIALKVFDYTYPNFLLTIAYRLLPLVLL